MPSLQPAEERVIQFYDWDEVRRELDSGDEAAAEAERKRTMAWIAAYRDTSVSPDSSAVAVSPEDVPGQK